MKRMLALILLLSLCFTANGFAESLFPSLFPTLEAENDDQAPSYGDIAHVDPTDIQPYAEGGTVVIYENVSEQGYQDFGKYLQGLGYEAVKTNIIGRVEERMLSNGKYNIGMVYRVDEKKMLLIYDAGVSFAQNTGEKTAEDEDKTAAFRTVGNTVTFGHYEQDCIEYNGAEEIEWLVLDVQDNKALLLSKYLLDAQPYHTSRVRITWENCSLRAWLNNQFLNQAFTSAEQAAILTTLVDNSLEQEYNLGRGYTGGNNTNDKIFLLSFKEANMYLDVKPSDQSSTGTNQKATAASTQYALTNTKVRYFLSSNESKTSEGKNAGVWWLRSNGYMDRVNPGATNVSIIGTFVELGDFNAIRLNEPNCGVRPALWVDLEEISNLLNR